MLTGDPVTATTVERFAWRRKLQQSIDENAPLSPERRAMRDHVLMLVAMANRTRDEQRALLEQRKAQSKLKKQLKTVHINNANNAQSRAYDVCTSDVTVVMICTLLAVSAVSP